MPEPRDDRYRRRFQVEHERAERYRDLALGLASMMPGLDLADFFDIEDIAEVVRRREAMENRGRRG